MKWLFAFLLFCFATISLRAQSDRDSIYSNFVLSERRNGFKEDLAHRVLNKNMNESLNASNEELFRESCAAIAQFIARSASIEKGFEQLFDKYQTLQYNTKRVFLEAVYASYPNEYEKEISSLLITENFPKLFAMEAVYLYRLHPEPSTLYFIKTYLANRFPDFKKNALLQELVKWLDQHSSQTHQPIPALNYLFAYQKKMGLKTIYSFQRWNRDYPGIAIIQNADGSFVREKNGQILMVEQLARAGSNLPYFLTNGNTPQGLFSITGTEVSHSLFIGPTPNFQMLMPYEADSSFWHIPYDQQKDSLDNYKNLFPEQWRNYAPMMESFYAGMVGRSEILSHGTTIDPAYFKGKSFYPLSPTQGCLCAKEFWDPATGRLKESEQFKLLKGFLSTPGTKGFLMVINLDNQQKAVSKKEIQALLNRKK